MISLILLSVGFSTLHVHEMEFSNHWMNFNKFTPFGLIRMVVTLLTLLLVLLYLVQTIDQSAFLHSHPSELQSMKNKTVFNKFAYNFHCRRSINMRLKEEGNCIYKSWNICGVCKQASKQSILFV